MDSYLKYLHLLFLPQVTLNKYIGSHQNDGLYTDLPFQNREHRKFKGKCRYLQYLKKKSLSKRHLQNFISIDLQKRTWNCCHNSCFILPLKIDNFGDLTQNHWEQFVPQVAVWLSMFLEEVIFYQNSTPEVILIGTATR